MLLWLLAVLLITALAACTQAADAGIPTASESQEASPGEANSAQTETTPASDDPEDKALAYAQCMRENGMPEFPEPDSEGRIKFRRPINPDSPELKQAAEACRHMAPEGWGEEKIDPEDQEVMLEFARCMRENGVPEFPDPDPNAGLRITPNDPKARAALEVCDAILQESGIRVRIGG